jgi:hypothetical protein
VGNLKWEGVVARQGKICIPERERERERVNFFGKRSGSLIAWRFPLK